MAVWEACKAVKILEASCAWETYTRSIENSTKWPTGHKHVEVASEGEQNDEDEDGDDCSIRGAMGHQTQEGILSGLLALQT